MTTLMEIRRPDFNWESMSKWWSAHSDGSHSPVSEEENLEDWEDYESCDDANVVFIDVVQRVNQIGMFFDADTEDESSDDGKADLLVELQEQGTSDLERSDYEIALALLVELQEHRKSRLESSSDDRIAFWLALLVELQELAEYVDITKELHSAHYLAPFFRKVLCYKYDAGIYNKHAAVRTKAAEVVTTMVHNNPTNQQLVMEVNGLQPLLDNFISDPDVTARTKALVAISALIRNNKPGITAFLLHNGYAAALRDALSSENVTLQRETLNLIQYLLHENSSDCNIVIELGLQEADIMVHLTSSDDAEVREAALRCLLVLARDESGHNGQLVKNDDKLKQVLWELIEGISAMAPEDLGAARAEIQLVDSLWNACYNEPSSLGEKGLLVLPGC